MKYLFLSVVFVFLATTPTMADSILGKATVIDGKTIEIQGSRLKLFGIDAPALTQNCDWPGPKKTKTIPCGKLAKWALMDLVIGARVSCTWKQKDKALAICKADGFDIAKNLVHTGWGLADRAQSKKYVVNENEAKAAKRGLWKGTFIPPKIWRATQTRNE